VEKKRKSRRKFKRVGSRGEGRESGGVGNIRKKRKKYYIM